ncbi:hypothetical protein ABZ490_46180 [Streptomyces sp. NPDC005811]|uniref:ATP-grasp domain-containing protein n=1 Tax=Streptomyces sp. NPDC005811 TaxID=3154565 RepID=UPI0033C5E522
MGILTLSTLNTVVERALARHGVTTTVITPFPLLDRRREADPDTEFLGIHKWADLRELQDIAHSVKNVDAVMTVDEQCVAAAGFLRDTLGIGGQSYRDALRTTNKHLMKAVVAAGPNPVPVAEHEVAHAIDDVRAAGARLGYPLILKPLSGFGAVSTFRVDSEEHLLELASEKAFEKQVPEPSGRASASAGVFQGLLSNGSAGFVVERRIDVASEFFCEMLWSGGRPLMTVTAQYSAPVLDLVGRASGLVTLDPRSEEHAAVVDLSVRACAALNLTDGFAHCEVMRDSLGQWWFGEVAARPGGQEIGGLTSRLLGYDIHDVIAAMARGEQPKIGSVYRCPQLASSVPLVPVGRVLRVPDREDVLAWDGVVDVEIMCRPGDVGSGSHHSTDAAAAYIFFEPSSPRNALDEMTRLASSFTIETAA